MAKNVIGIVWQVEEYELSMFPNICILAHGLQILGKVTQRWHFMKQNQKQWSVSFPYSAQTIHI